MSNYMELRKKMLRVNFILDAIAAYFGITTETLMSRRRRHDIAHTRQVAMYVLRRYLELPFETIGAILHRHHTTVIYGCDEISRRIKSDPQTWEDVEAIAELIKPSQHFEAVA